MMDDDKIAGILKEGDGDGDDGDDVEYKGITLGSGNMLPDL